MLGSGFCKHIECRKKKSEGKINLCFPPRKTGARVCLVFGVPLGRPRPKLRFQILHFSLISAASSFLLSSRECGRNRFTKTRKQVDGMNTVGDGAEGRNNTVQIWLKKRETLKSFNSLFFFFLKSTLAPLSFTAIYWRGKKKTFVKAYRGNYLYANGPDGTCPWLLALSDQTCPPIIQCAGGSLQSQDGSFIDP